MAEQWLAASPSATLPRLRPIDGSWAALCYSYPNGVGAMTWLSNYLTLGSLIQPEESERILNGVRERPLPDWEKQFAKAITAFRGNGFLVLIDGRQITDLDETIRLTAQSQITFLKLVPLVGG